jgi:Zn-dependent protease with chaperone function
MMEKFSGLRWLLLKNAFLVLLALFTVPALTWCFSQYVLTQEKTQLLPPGTGSLVLEDQRGKTLVRLDSVADICTLQEAELAGFRETLCPRYKKVWQFAHARTVAWWTLIGGVVLLLLIVLLSALAFVNRSLRLASFVAGRQLMTFASVASIIMQGVMCVWLIFWAAKYFLHVRPIQIVFIIGFAVIIGVAIAVREIFRKPEMNSEFEGELIPKNSAPQLWHRIRQMAAQLRTAPPEHLIAGIDDNFFVTEAPMTVQGKKLQGRKLFVSIPLLRQLAKPEADAVLAHELAHFAGGDTCDTTQLWPRLMQYDIYLANIRQARIACFVWPFMVFYRLIFELALARNSREREYRADSTAARLVSSLAISRALVKIGAYATYRAEMEDKLFGHNKKLDETLGIAARVAEGIIPWTQSPEFGETMSHAHISHPFDSHPPLQERMKNVACEIPQQQFAEIVASQPLTTWVEEISDAAELEARLWSTYEKEFAQSHEENLAYRYDPTNASERELVLKYFPPQRFALAHGRWIEINCETIVSSEGEVFYYDSIKDIGIKDGNCLVVALTERGVVFGKKVKISLKGVEQLPVFQEAVGRYWFRHQAMCDYIQWREEQKNRDKA